MENSPLNEAHYQHRKAERNIRRHNFQEAIKCHQRAAELLTDSMNHTASPKALESIKLQHDYHVKQTEIVGIKMNQQDSKKNSEKKDGVKRGKNHLDHYNNCLPPNLKIAVNKTLDDADSLVNMLVQKSRENTLESIKYQGNNEEPPIDFGRKEPKGDKLIIEELHIVNQQLRNWIRQLFEKLEKIEQENQDLKMKHKITVDIDDIDNAKAEGSSSSSPQTDNQFPIIMTDSSNNSPYVFSPCVNLSPEDTEIKDLPPLEMPDFDFDAMMKELKLKREANKGYSLKRDS